MTLIELRRLNGDIRGLPTNAVGDNGTSPCDLCHRETPDRELSIGSFTARGEELVLCDDCKKGNCLLGV